MYTIPYYIKDLVEFLLSAYTYNLLHVHVYMYDKVHFLVYLTFFDYTSSASGTGAKGSHSVTLGEGEQTLPYVHLKEIVYKQILIWFSLNAAFFYLSRVSLITLIQAGRELFTLLLITNIRPCGLRLAKGYIDF